VRACSCREPGAAQPPSFDDFAQGYANTASGELKDELKELLALLSVGLALHSAVVGFPLLSSDKPAPMDWVGWVYGLCGDSTALFSLTTLTKTGPGVSPKMSSGIGAMLGIQQLMLTATRFGEQQQHNVVEDVDFGFHLAGCLVAIANPVKFLGTVGAILVAVLDVVMGLAQGVLQIVEAFLPSTSVTPLPAGAQVP
jgi:hypothetical protein